LGDCGLRRVIGLRQYTDSHQSVNAPDPKPVAASGAQMPTASTTAGTLADGEYVVRLNPTSGSHCPVLDKTVWLKKDGSFQLDFYARMGNYIRGVVGPDGKINATSDVGGFPTNFTGRFDGKNFVGTVSNTQCTFQTGETKKVS
jgi:hypothetical protein